MIFIDLALHPRRFFERRADSINWAWPLAGFYLFAFGSFFQRFIVEEYRVPYWAIVFVVGWAPSVMLAAVLFIFLVLLWYWPASNVLGTGQPLPKSTRVIGISLLPPGMLLTVSLIVLATAKSNAIAAPYQTIVAVLHGLNALWALALAVLAGKILMRLSMQRTALFALWLTVVVVAFGMLLYAVDN